jgi:hypothetical protein
MARKEKMAQNPKLHRGTTGTIDLDGEERPPE